MMHLSGISGSQQTRYLCTDAEDCDSASDRNEWFRMLRGKRDSTQIRYWLHNGGANVLRGETQQNASSGVDRRIF